MSELARSGTTVARLATTFGMTEATIDNWLRQDRIDRGEIPRYQHRYGAGLGPAKRGIRQLETELAVSRKVNEVFLGRGLPPRGSSR